MNDETRFALAEQAADEVAAVFDQIPDSVMYALNDSAGPDWFTKAQDAWCARRFAELETEYESNRQSAMADRMEDAA